MITPSYQALSLFVALLASTTTVSGQDRAADTERTPAKELELRQSLLGAWVLAGSIDRPIEPAADAEMKLWGLGHFVVTKRNSETGEIDYHHLGTYKLDGDLYSETITYAIGATKELVGRTFNFKIAVDGDTYTQQGLGNPWNQQWKRLGSIEDPNDGGARSEIEKSETELSSPKRGR